MKQQMWVIMLILGVWTISLHVYPTQAQSIPSPTVSLSDDEKVFHLSYNGDSWDFYRPTTPATTFSASNTTYWVSTDGNDDDDNEGNESSPFRTINRGIEALTPGDVLYVKAGTYLEHVNIEKSGTANAPIIISAAPGQIGHVKVSVPPEVYQADPATPIFRLAGVQHLWLNGFVIEGTRGKPGAAEDETFSAVGVWMRHETGEGVRITNNIIYNQLHAGIKGGTDNVLLEGNIIFDNGTGSTDHGIYAFEDNVQMIGNIIFNHPGYGIHSYPTPQYHTIMRNITFDNVLSGILVAGANNTIIHNVSSYNVDAGIILFRGDAKNNTVKNNIMYRNRFNYMIDDQGGNATPPSGNIVDYNLYALASQADIHPNTSVGGNGLYDDPLFVNPESGDYRLQEGSPAIDAGTNVGFDYEGNGPDLGVFEGNASGIIVIPSDPENPVDPVDPGVCPEGTNAPPRSDNAPNAPKNICVDPRQGQPVIEWRDDVNAQWFNFYIVGPNNSMPVNNVWYAKPGAVASNSQTALVSCDNGICSLALPESYALVGGGTYTVWIRAWGTPNGNINNGLFSKGGTAKFGGRTYAEFNTATFTIPTTRPSQPSGMTVTTEMTGTNAGNGQPIFSWSAADGVIWYQIWVGNPDAGHLQDWTFATDLDCIDPGSTCSYQLPDVMFDGMTHLPAGEYDVWLNSWGPAGFAQSSEGQGWAKITTFQVDNS